jgi:hypothetical protein
MRDILNELEIKQNLDKNAVEKLIEIDSKGEVEIFGDSTIRDACSIVDLKAVELGLKKDKIGKQLFYLTQTDPLFYPYIQILHCQCVISEYYDHFASNLYEFAPRGNIPEMIFKLYNEHTSTGNPFLNNAKAVDTININWANSRDTNIEQAYALVDILESFNNLNYPSSKELASYIRKWVFRVLQLNTKPKNLLHSFSDSDILKTIKYISSNETNTQGILEQRIMDYCCVLIHNNKDGWRSRGIGDSVNANNLSRKKFGDIEFINHNTLNLCAYEIHGGVLTQNYVEGHHRSLKRVFEIKRDELESIDSIEKWKIKIIYIAHKNLGVSNTVYPIDGINIEYEFITFKDFLSKFGKKNNEMFNALVITTLNTNRTPSYVRTKLTDIISS